MTTTKKQKYAALSMDIEEWYHTGYLKSAEFDTSYSMLDGISKYLELLDRHHVKATFFVLSELAPTAKEAILRIVRQGHEIACHGKTHQRPITMPVSQFYSELREAKDVLEQISGKEVIGYRASCFGIDDERYRIISELGFRYSSSKMDSKYNPRYGSLDLSGFNQPLQGVYEKDGFYEFALSTQSVLGTNVPVSGGGWIRMLPWHLLMKQMIKRNLRNADTYAFYVHPFELSNKKMIWLKQETFLTNVRTHIGLGSVEKKTEQLIALLVDQHFRIVTYSEMMKQLSSTGNHSQNS